MVPGMSVLLRWAGPAVVTLVTAALVLGINGFMGAIHSVHHLAFPVEPQEHAAHDRGHDGRHGQTDPAPADSPSESCPVAAAALHLTATDVGGLPAVEPSRAEATSGTPRPQGAPRQAFREPGAGRAPPSFRSTPG